MGLHWPPTNVKVFLLNQTITSSFPSNTSISIIEDKMSVSYLIRQQLYVIKKPNNKIKELINKKRTTERKRKNRPAMRACSYCVLVCIGMRVRSHLVCTAILEKVVVRPTYH